LQRKRQNLKSEFKGKLLRTKLTPYNFFYRSHTFSVTPLKASFVKTIGENIYKVYIFKQNSQNGCGNEDVGLCIGGQRIPQAFCLENPIKRYENL